MVVLSASLRAVEEDAGEVIFVLTQNSERCFATMFDPLTPRDHASVAPIICSYKYAAAHHCAVSMVECETAFSLCLRAARLRHDGG